MNDCCVMGPSLQELVCKKTLPSVSGNFLSPFGHPMNLKVKLNIQSIKKICHTIKHLHKNSFFSSPQPGQSQWWPCVFTKYNHNHSFNDRTINMLSWGEPTRYDSILWSVAQTAENHHSWNMIFARKFWTSI